jgi:hypothetical protein
MHILALAISAIGMVSIGQAASQTYLICSVASSALPTGNFSPASTKP